MDGELETKGIAPAPAHLWEEDDLGLKVTGRPLLPWQKQGSPQRSHVLGSAQPMGRMCVCTHTLWAVLKLPWSSPICS